MRTKNLLKYLILSIIIILQSMQIGTINSYASSGSVTVYVTTDSISIGNAVSASVTVGLDQALGAYTVYVSYDPSVLQYDGGSGALINGGAGTVAITGVGDGSSTSQTISLNFTAIGNGYSNVASSGEVYDWNDGASSVSYGASGVTVETKSNNNTDDNEDDKEDQNNNDDSESNDCNLASLQISPGELSPSFSENITYYEVTVSEDTTSMVVSATTKKTEASVYVAGAGLIEPGDNTVSITVTAPNGATKTYTLSVTAGEKKDEAFAMIDNKKYRFATEEEVLNKPESFKITTAQYKEFKVLAFESPNKKIKVVCLLDEKNTNYWYVINEEKGEFIPFLTYSSKFNRYFITDLPEGIIIPEGYQLSEINISGNTVKAYQFSADSNIYLVYAINVDGDEGLYLYDNIESSFIRYIKPFVQVEEEKEEVATPTEPVIIPNNEGFFTKDVLLYISIGTGILSFILLICMIIFIARSKYYKNQLEEAEDMMEAISGGEKTAADKIIESFYVDSNDDNNIDNKDNHRNDNKDLKDVNNNEIDYSTINKQNDIMVTNSTFIDSAFTDSAFTDSAFAVNEIVSDKIDNDNLTINETNDNNISSGIDLIKIDQDNNLD